MKPQKGKKGKNGKSRGSTHRQFSYPFQTACSKSMKSAGNSLQAKELLDNVFHVSV